MSLIYVCVCAYEINEKKDINLKVGEGYARSSKEGGCEGLYMIKQGRKWYNCISIKTY